MAAVAPNAGLIVVGVVMLVGLYAIVFEVIPAMVRGLKGVKKKRFPPA